MFCRLCGTENPDDSKFCIKCGKELVTVGQATTADTAVKEIEITPNTQTPANLVDSTKLMFKDIFRYGKCMSRADYWYGVLGLSLLTLAVVIGLVCCIILASRITQYYVIQALIYMVIFTSVTGIISLFLMGLSATVRRLHDIGMDGAWILLQFVPFGNIIILVFMCQPSVMENNRYRQETQSSFGKKVYSIKGLVPVVVLCLGLVGTLLLCGIVNSDSAVDDTDSTELYYNSTDELDDY